MKTSKTAKITLLILTIVVIAALSLSAIHAVGSTTFANGEPQEAESIKILHITDIHYFPLGYGCTLSTNYAETSAYARVNSGASKLLLESTCVLESACKQISELSADEMPDVIVASGDITSNGELRAMIDVANTLRQLQNDCRKVKPDFQIFITPGNHDLYNDAGCYYDENGNKVTAAKTKNDYLGITAANNTIQLTTRMELSLIFEGLGFDNWDEQDAINAYKEWGYYTISAADAALLPYKAPVVDGEYTTYVRSLNSTAYSYAYMYEDFEYGDSYGLVYRTADGKEDNNFDSYDTNEMDYLDYDLGWMSFVAVGKTNGFTFFSLDVVMGTNQDGHVLGGTLQESTKAWMTSDDVQALLNEHPQNTRVATMHHNVLNHFASEENYTTGFVLYGWEDAAEFLTDNDVRYVFTGHEHANDIEPYMSYDNKVLYDFETASLISLGMNYRITEITRYNDDQKILEKVRTSLHPIKVVDLSTLYDNDYMTDESAGKYASFINEQHQITDVVSYMTTKVANDMIIGVLDEYLSPSIVSRLSSSAAEKVDGLDLNSLLDKLPAELSFLKTYTAVVTGDNVEKLISNLLNQVNSKILDEGMHYEYKGDLAVYKEEDAKLFAYANDLVYKLVDYKIATDENGNAKTIADLAIWSYSQYVLGQAKPVSRNDLPQWVKDGFAKLENGEVVGFIVDSLLDKNSGLYPILEGLLNTDLDLTAGISKSDVDKFDQVLAILDSTKQPVTLAKFNLSRLVSSAWGIATPVFNRLDVQLDIDLSETPVLDLLNGYITDYYTESLKVGLGELIAQVLIDFACDQTSDGNLYDSSEKLNVVYLKNDTYAYYGGLRSKADIPATIENGKAPSMITVTFGDDPTTDKNFVYYTSKHCNKTYIQYCEGATFKSGNAVTVEGTFEQIYYTDCIFNLGLWSTTTDKVIGKHVVSLTGLKPDTTYSYKLGDGEAYWSDVYVFKTAPASGSFNVMLIADMQNMTELSYDRTSEKITATATAMNKDYDFIINLGDFVDYGRNWDLWSYALDKNAEIFANTTMVAATGNHDEKAFELNKKTVVKPGVNTDSYNNMVAHFKFGNAVEQLSGVYYSFEYCGVLFVVLNTNDITDNKLSDEQYAWCESTLKNSACVNKVVIMHKSLYSLGVHADDPDIVGMRAQLTKLFADNGVDLVIAGHDHSYSESYYLDAEGKNVGSLSSDGNLADNGVLYVTVGTIGEKYYKTTSNDLIAYGSALSQPALTQSTYGVLKVADGKMNYVGYQMSDDFISTALYSVTNVAAPQKNRTWIIWVILGVFIVFMVLVSIIPQKRRQKKIDEMMSGLKVGTKIETIGGVIGVIVEMNGDQFVIDAGENDSYLMTVHKRAIMKVVEAGGANTDSASSDQGSATDNYEQTKSVEAPEVIETEDNDKDE